MDLNSYSNKISSVTDIKNHLNDTNLDPEDIPGKIADTVGEALTAEGTKHLLGHVVSPLTKKALSKIGMSSEDADDISRGRIGRIAIRKLKSKLGGETSEGGKMGDVLNEPDKFNDYIKNTGLSNIDNDIENTRKQISGLSSIDEKEPLSNIENILRPNPVLDINPDVGNLEQITDQGLPTESSAFDVGRTLTGPSKVLEDFRTGELDPSSLQVPKTIFRKAGTLNTGGDAAPLVNEEGGNISKLSNITGATDSSNAAAGSVAKDISKNIGEDEGLTDATEDLGEAAAASADVPVVGEILAPLLAIGAGIASIFGHHKETQPKMPVLNPSFQFL